MLFRCDTLFQSRVAKKLYECYRLYTMIAESGASAPEIYNGEERVTAGAGAIFYIRDEDSFMFFLRDDKPEVPYPNQIDIIGGAMDAGETPEQTARREFAEELIDLDSGEPFNPVNLRPFIMGEEHYGIIQNLFGCELETRPNLQLLEGQQLVYLTRAKIATTQFAFGYADFASRYADFVGQHWETAPEHPTHINNIVYPLGYFAAQVSFAQKWVGLTGDSMEETLRNRTALCRVITNDKNPKEDNFGLWNTALRNTRRCASTKDLTIDLYKAYCDQPFSHHQDVAQAFNAFSYDYRETDQTIQLHFDNPKRGESPLSANSLPQRQAEFKALLENVQAEHPEARRFIVGTWLFEHPGFRSLFPVDIALGEPPVFSLQGNSLWGQFVNSAGKVNQRAYNSFINALQKSRTVDALMEAFPYKVLFTNDEIGKYYEFYNI